MIRLSQVRLLLVKTGILISCAWLLVRLWLAFQLFRLNRRSWPLAKLLLTREECRELAPHMVRATRKDDDK